MNEEGKAKIVEDQWILYQDNVPAHSALAMKQFLADKCIPVLKHTHYSVDLAPCDSYLFPKMKSVLKGLIFSVSLR
jgi:hypothetical protein